MDLNIQNSSATQTKRGRIESLQALRAFAFLGIFFIHAGFFVEWATLGVSVFFVMSGFLMYISYENKSFDLSFINNLKFSINKLKKLYPLHIITMIFMIILNVYTMIHYDTVEYSAPIIFIDVLLNIPLLQTWFPDASVNVALNGVAWYLSVTMFLYFVFPFLLKIIKKTNTLILVIISIFILIIEVVSCVPFLKIFGNGSMVYTWFMYCFPVFRLGDFLVGMVVGKIYLNHPEKIEYKYNIVIATIVELISLFLTVRVFKLIKKYSENIFIIAAHNWTTVYIIIAAIWVYLFARKNGLLTIILSNRLFVKLGNISSYLFLIHYVIIQYIQTYMNIKGIGMELSNPERIALVLFEFILSLLCSLIYKKCFEKGKPYIVF